MLLNDNSLKPNIGPIFTYVSNNIADTNRLDTLRSINSITNEWIYKTLDKQSIHLGASQGLVGLSKSVRSKDIKQNRKHRL